MKTIMCLSMYIGFASGMLFAGTFGYIPQELDRLLLVGIWISGGVIHAISKKAL